MRFLPRHHFPDCFVQFAIRIRFAIILISLLYIHSRNLYLEIGGTIWKAGLSKSNPKPVDSRLSNALRKRVHISHLERNDKIDRTVSVSFLFRISNYDCSSLTRSSASAIQLSFSRGPNVTIGKLERKRNDKLK